MVLMRAPAGSAYAQQHPGKRKINQQGYGIDDGGDEGRGHNSRVKAQAVGDDRQGAAHYLGTDDCDSKSKADHQIYVEGDAEVAK